MKAHHGILARELTVGPPDCKGFNVSSLQEQSSLIGIGSKHLTDAPFFMHALAIRLQQLIAPPPHTFSELVPSASPLRGSGARLSVHAAKTGSKKGYAPPSDCNPAAAAGQQITA
jgi:hypothetical protein